MATADIRRFTGFIAPDGTTHDTQKKAAEYTKVLKIKQALVGFVDDLNEGSGPGELGVAYNDSGEGHNDEDSTESQVIYRSDLATFLFANKDLIEAAFNQAVTHRKPRAKKVVPASISGLVYPPAAASIASSMTA